MSQLLHAERIILNQSAAHVCFPMLPHPLYQRYTKSERFEFRIRDPDAWRCKAPNGHWNPPWGASQSMPIVAQLEEPRYMLMRQVLSEMTWSLRACLRCKLSRSSA